MVGGNDMRDKKPELLVPAGGLDGVQGLHIERTHQGKQNGIGDVLHQRHEGVSEHVPERDLAARNTLCPRQTDVVLIGLVHHVPPQPHGIVGDVADGQGSAG